jgi:bifunctional ADP-heptose synthase (sugar kinase/adenylyltransferase)
MKVLVIGETCVDRFVYCDAKRLSPEAPVPVLTPIKTIENPGMAGNTYENVKALAPKAVMASISQKAKITKTRYVEEKSNHMFLRVDEGEDFDCQFMWGPFSDSSLAEADIVIVSDYNKGFLSNADLKEIARKSTLSILDSKRKLTDDIVKGFTFVKLNEQERNNNPKLTSSNIITTLGKHGAEYRGIKFKSPQPQDTIDVSGAGDTFTAAFITKYFQTKDEGISIKYANVQSSKVVTKKGVVTP